MKRLESSSRSVPREPFGLMFRVYRYVLPEVRSQLQLWREAASRIPDLELRKQAMDSITSKQFHCQGGAVYASAHLSMRHVIIPLIVAFQTICDYLDNLCDRSTSLDPLDFRQLHQAMLDAIDPSAPLHDYYALRLEKDDADYLNDLVKTCQSCICLLPSYSLVVVHIREFVGLYCDLQVYKHIHKELRDQELYMWCEKHNALCPELKWNEFAAATGSTLGVFMLFLAASHRNYSIEQIENIRDAYFPYIAGLHILLDYLIDQEEDLAGGDLNFCSYYNNRDETIRRITFMVKSARAKILCLEHTRFHRMIIEGLLALYLSDPKIKSQTEVRKISKQLMKNSPITRIFFWVNSVYIRFTS